MIGYLSGKPIVNAYGTLILCSGVGYSVLLSKSNQQDLIGKELCEVFIYSHIKEDAFDLYGFLTQDEKELFLKLIAVDGVGPKTALGIMDRGVESIVKAVQTADVSFFSSVTRVGKKSAQKIIIDLKNKLGGKEDLDLLGAQGNAKEIVEALISLGFSETESTKVVKSIDTENVRIEDSVKEAIRKLTNKPHFAEALRGKQAD